MCVSALGKLSSEGPALLLYVLKYVCALRRALSAIFIIDLSTFHNLLLEVSPHWLQHCMLCLNSASALAGLCVSGWDTLSGPVPVVFLLSKECQRAFSLLLTLTP